MKINLMTNLFEKKVIFILFFISFYSCNEKDELKQKLMSELYATQDIIIDGESVMDSCDINILGFEKDVLHLPGFREDKHLNNSRWDLEIKNDKSYLIIKDTRFKGKYEIQFFDHDNVIIFTSDRIKLKVQRAL